MPVAVTAKFQCCKCPHSWEGPPDSAFGGCPQCGHAYSKWVNYEQWKKAPGKSDAFKKVYP